MIRKYTCQQGDSQIYRMRVVKEDGTQYDTADIDTLTLHVWDTSDGTRKTPTLGESLTVADCVNADQAWDSDSEGFNFRIPVNGSYLEDADTLYQCQVDVEDSLGNVFQLDHVQYKTSKTYS